MDIRLDEGFLFGMGAFETIAVEKGKPILLEKHIERLEKAADFLQLGSCSARGFSKEKVVPHRYSPVFPPTPPPSAVRVTEIPSAS